MLIGSASGLCLGSLLDLEDIDEMESALCAISSSVQVGRTALLAIVSELNPEVIDAAMSDLGGTVLRRSVADVEAEIAAAEDAERKAKWKPTRSLPRSHREHDKAAVDAKLDQLKAKLSRGQKAPAQGSGRGWAIPFWAPPVGPLYPISRLAPQYLHPW
jgi:hypothetical protein